MLPQSTQPNLYLSSYVFLHSLATTHCVLPITSLSRSLICCCFLSTSTMLLSFLPIFRYVSTTPFPTAFSPCLVFLMSTGKCNPWLIIALSLQPHGSRPETSLQTVDLQWSLSQYTTRSCVALICRLFPGTHAEPGSKCSWTASDSAEDALWSAHLWSA